MAQWLAFFRPSIDPRRAGGRLKGDVFLSRRPLGRDHTREIGGAPSSRHPPGWFAYAVVACERVAVFSRVFPYTSARLRFALVVRPFDCARDSCATRRAMLASNDNSYMKEYVRRQRVRATRDVNAVPAASPARSS